MQRRRLGREFKVEAVRLIKERGVSVAQAARDLDVYENVLRKWVRELAVDHGSEFVSRGLDLWAYANNVVLDFSRPGKPTDNAFIQAFNGRLRAECLNAHWFMTLADAAEKLEDLRIYYNTDRPHGAIGNKLPILLQNPGSAHSPLP